MLFFFNFVLIFHFRSLGDIGTPITPTPPLWMDHKKLCLIGKNMFFFVCLLIFFIVFSNFSPLEPVSHHFWPQIRILHSEILPGDTSWGLETWILNKKLDPQNLKFQNFSFSYIFPPGSKNLHFSTSDSDSSSKTVYIATWIGLESQNLVKIQTNQFKK